MIEVRMLQMMKLMKQVTLSFAGVRISAHLANFGSLRPIVPNGTMLLLSATIPATNLQKLENHEPAR